MDTIQAILKRYSCRAFTDQAPSDADLETIALAAAASPSGMNRQNWRIIVVTNPQLLADMEAEGMKNLAALPDKGAYDRIMSRGGKLYYSAPSMIVVPIKQGEPGGGEALDCGIVSENIAIAAAGLGINSLICGMAAFSFSGARGEEFKRRLGFPEDYGIGIAVLLGYAARPGGKPHEPDLSKITYIK
ncbi:MAG: nitroreductase family protein [Oscillospiraceae bacterium]|jgi:nitroreductase|nr:nitroreductase family protein [Oscillospiraceae bacterium]